MRRSSSGICWSASKPAKRASSSSRCAPKRAAFRAFMPTLSRRLVAGSKATCGQRGEDGVRACWGPAAAPAKPAIVTTRHEVVWSALSARRDAEDKGSHFGRGIHLKESVVLVVFPVSTIFEHLLSHGLCIQLWCTW